MNKVIYKYKLEVADSQVINIPKSAIFLSIQPQYDDACMWFLVNPEYPTQPITFEVFGTGHPIPQDKSRLFLGTFQLRGGDLVFHCFQVL